MIIESYVVDPPEQERTTSRTNSQARSQAAIRGLGKGRRFSVTHTGGTSMQVTELLEEQETT